MFYKSIINSYHLYDVLDTSLVANGMYEIAVEINKGNTAPQRIVLLKSENLKVH